MAETNRSKLKSLSVFKIHILNKKRIKKTFRGNCDVTSGFGSPGAKGTMGHTFNIEPIKIIKLLIGNRGSTDENHETIATGLGDLWRQE